MMHSILESAVFVLMVLLPCLLARFSSAPAPDKSDANVLEDGFI